MYRLSVTAFILVVGAVAMCEAVQAQGLIEIERYVWTDNVDRPTREAGRVHKSPIRIRQVYLWTQLKGSRELLDQMRASADGQVRIRHLWQRYDSDELVVDLDMPLSIGRREDLRKLAYEVEALGFFRWRVWSNKEYLTRGHWRVDVVYDETYDPVMCLNADRKSTCLNSSHRL